MVLIVTQRHTSHTPGNQREEPSSPWLPHSIQQKTNELMGRFRFIPLNIDTNDYDVMMLAQTIASRDIQYYTPMPKHITPVNFPLDEILPPTQHHLDWIKSFHKL